MDDSFKVLWEHEKTTAIAGGTSVAATEMGQFTIPAGYRDRFLLVLAELKDASGKLISRSFYYPRVLSKMDDATFYKDYTTTPIPWIALEKGPWLKTSISAAPQTVLTVSAGTSGKAAGNTSRVRVKVSNTGTVPAFMTKIDITGVKRAIVAEDNYFWLAAGESRNIDLEVLWREPSETHRPVVTVKAFNSNEAKTGVDATVK